MITSRGDIRIRSIPRRVKSAFASLPASFYQYSGMGFTYWAAMTAPSFSVIYLQSLGFSALEIGSMSAVFTLINIVSPPFWGVASDKLRSVRKVLIICVSFSAIAWFLLPFMVSWVSPVMVLLMLPIYRFFGAPTMALQDSWIIQHVNNDRRIGFGPIRIWGSVGYAIVAYVFSVLLKTRPLDIVFYGHLLLAAPCIAIMLFMKDEERGVERSVPLRDMQLSRIVKSAPLMAYLTFNMLLYTPIMASFTFMPYLVQAVGEHDSFLGVVMCVEAVLEIPLLLYSARLLKRFKITHMIIACACLYTVEITLYGFCQASWQIVAVKCLHGLGYGLYLSSTVQYMYRLAPKGLTSTAQSLVSCSNALASMLGNFFGGAIIHYLDVRAFFRFSGLFTLATVAAYTIWLKKYGGALREAEAADG